MEIAKRRRQVQKRNGFTLVEMMVVVVIIGLLATVIITQVGGAIDKARVATTKAIISEIETALERFKMDFGRYPEKIADLVNMPSYVDPSKWPKGGYLRSIPLDGWGEEFIFVCPSQYDAPYDVISYGADKKQGGDGVDADIWNHSKYKQ